MDDLGILRSSVSRDTVRERRKPQETPSSMTRKLVHPRTGITSLTVELDVLQVWSSYPLAFKNQLYTMIWDWIFSYRGPLIDDIIYI